MCLVPFAPFLPSLASVGAPYACALDARVSTRVVRAKPSECSAHTRDSKILGEFYHKKTVNKKRVERGHTKKTEHRKNIAFETTSPNERKATRTTCRHPTTRRTRREHGNARERNRTHANTLAVCNIVIQQIHTTWTLAFDILLTYTFSKTNARTRKQTTLRQRSATSKAQKSNERTAKYEQYGFVTLLRRRPRVRVRITVR